jgi:hypothetical protein
MSDEKPDFQENPPEEAPPDESSHDDFVYGPGSDKAIAPPEQRDPTDAGLPQFVTVLTPMEQQVGMHVINALQHPETVAVITTVAMGKDGMQRIVSVGLDPETLQQIEELVVNAREERTKRVPCIGFQCVLEDREREEEQKKGGDES